jgi:hypothetical protein
MAVDFVGEVILEALLKKFSSSSLKGGEIFSSLSRYGVKKFV